MPTNNYQDELLNLLTKKFPSIVWIWWRHEVPAFLSDFIETQISLAREEWDNKLIKALELWVEKENKAYEQWKLDGRAEMKAQCLAVIPEDRNSHDDYADKFYNMALRHSRNSISSL